MRSSTFPGSVYGRRWTVYGKKLARNKKIQRTAFPLNRLPYTLHRMPRSVQFYGLIDSDSLNTPRSSEGKKRLAGSQRRSQFLL